LGSRRFSARLPTPGATLRPRPAAATVGDFGCGTGGNLALLVGPIGPSGRVIGFDLSPEMFEQAQGVQYPSASILVKPILELTTLRILETA